MPSATRSRHSALGSHPFDLRGHQTLAANTSIPIRKKKGTSIYEPPCLEPSGELANAQKQVSGIGEEVLMCMA